MKIIDDSFFDGSTWGAELESGMCDSKVTLPEGNTWSTREYEPNSDCGVSIDDKKEFNLYGGEVQLKPTNSEIELYNRIQEMKKIIKHPEYNEKSYITSMHVHIRIPKLLADPALLKECMLWSNKWDPILLPIIMPLKDVNPDRFTKQEHYKWFEREQRERRAARHKTLNKGAVRRLEEVEPTSVTDVIQSLVPKTKKPPHRPVWLAYQRTAVNYAKIRHTETIEFRMFSYSDNPKLMMNTIEFAKKYMICAITQHENPVKVFEDIEYPGILDWGTKEPPEVIENLIHTNVKHNNREDIIKYIESKLLSGSLTLDELNNPPYWDYLIPKIKENKL